MARTLKIVLGVLTFTPLIIGVLTVFQILRVVLSVTGTGGSVAPDAIDEILAETLVMNVVAAGLGVVLMLFYIWHLFVRRASLDSKEQLLWFVLLLLFGVFTMPVYWLVHVWNESPAAAQQPPPRRRVRARPAR